VISLFFPSYKYSNVSVRTQYIPELPNTPAIGMNAVANIFWFYVFRLWEGLLPAHLAKLLQCSFGRAGFKDEAARAAMALVADGLRQLMPSAF
jgi:uncharacterized membrane protein YccF (DUF307 family)